VKAMENDRTFIETQFPVSKLSKESYKERKANYSQTLTGLGKWWGRKPLIMVRAAILGLLLPASSDPKKDRDIFLKILTMDEDGLWRRKTRAIPLKEVFARLTPAERQHWFVADSSTPSPLVGEGWGGGAERTPPKFLKGITAEQKNQLQRLAFSRMSYDEKLAYCDRPEQIEGPSETAWQEINAHLGTDAQSLPDLVRQLGERRFGHTPRVGDAFCGGGSVPFEAARIGCEAYGSDLNPVAALLTWGALNIVGGGAEVAEQVRDAQRRVYETVDRQITEWGIEHNEQGDRADAYLYCTETQCPECGWSVPLAPSWVIGEKTMTIARLVPAPSPLHPPTPTLPHQGGGSFRLTPPPQPSPTRGEGAFVIEIHQGTTRAALEQARTAGTVRDSRLVCPHCGESTPMTAIRGDRRGQTTEYRLRLWENEDLVPRPDDVFQERLYCIRWVHTWTDTEGKIQRERYYRAPDGNDLRREARVLELLRERFADWQEKGYIPSRRIEPGDETTRLMRERGWTHWHHLFTPRQLLTVGLLDCKSERHTSANLEAETACLLGVQRCTNWTSRLTGWDSSAANEKGNQTFQNQALNTLSVYLARPLTALESVWFYKTQRAECTFTTNVAVTDAHSVSNKCNIWITDPPYADAINYHELSEFFLAWYEKHLPKLFPEWYADSKRALAIRGSGKEFRQGMVDAYRNLAAHTPDNGLQIVMFTHQDAGVWADLALILWAAGLRVTAAWTIATETESALKEGNYVQGTVLMVLRKQTSQDVAFLDEIVPQVEIEVENQLQSMLALDDREDPNFSDADYQLAAYAAALRVLTQYQGIEDLDVAYELSRERKRGEASPIERIIEDAVKTASNFLVPSGIDAPLWKRLSPEEKLYLKCLEVESHGDYRSGVFQEFARGFGVRDYPFMLQSGKANQTRLKTATEFKRRDWGTEGFGSSLLRHALFAVYQTADQDHTKVGLTYLKTEIADYWAQRENLVEMLGFIGKLPIPHWTRDAEAARLLAGAVENDHV
jgi:adenine-specific DNA methylase